MKEPQFRESSAEEVRVALFTDTYADINGPSRFIQNIADEAIASGKSLEVFTSTSKKAPQRVNVRNFKPLARMRMPRYPELDLVIPPVTAMLRAVELWRPHVIHVSTPGPVGLVGLLAAWKLGVPLAGVYHTDFPAYIDRLFDDHVLTGAAARFMVQIYGRFRVIFTRSVEYSRRLQAMGIDGGRVVALRPGIVLQSFAPHLRRTAIWEELELELRAGRRSRSDSVCRVLYCGRVSVEKNLRFLAEAWRCLRARMRGRRQGATRAELVIIGDGPFREEMESALAGDDVRFLGYRHGVELAELYASSDLFVFPSVTDTLGQVVMEAQASGLPALVSSVGGPREIVEDRISGRVLATDSPDEWARAILELVDDEDLRSAMSTRAVALMQKRSITDSFAQFWAVHERVASER